MLGMAADSGDDGVVNEIHGVGGARIFRQAVIVVVGLVGFWINDHVFQHRAKTQRIPNLRLLFPGKMNAFCVAAAFEVEDAVGTPAVLVIADQPPLRIGRERSLASAGEAKKQGGDTV